MRDALLLHAMAALFAVAWGSLVLSGWGMPL